MALQADNLEKEYTTPHGPLRILSGISLSLARGSSASIMGPSGSGKSTLLHILGALEPPSGGTVLLEGQNPFEMEEKELAALRNRQIGFVFQDHCLLPQCTVLENVLIPTLVPQAPRSEGGWEDRARTLLSQIGLADRTDHRPAQLSGGERQRVALARALIHDPLLLLCDEPTGNLDSDSAQIVADLLFDLHRRQQNMLIVVTHNAELGKRFPERFQLRGGELLPN